MINILFYKMEVQNNLKSLFNQIFPDSIGTEKTPSNLEYCFSKLLESNQKDYLITSIHLFSIQVIRAKRKIKIKNFGLKIMKNQANTQSITLPLIFF